MAVESRIDHYLVQVCITWVIVRKWCYTNLQRFEENLARKTKGIQNRNILLFRIGNGIEGDPRLSCHPESTSPRFQISRKTKQKTGRFTEFGQQGPQTQCSAVLQILNNGSARVWHPIAKRRKFVVVGNRNQKQK